jgi:uncharacterized protein (TIGR00369 family)
METKRDPEKLKQKLLEFARDFPLFQMIGLELLDVGPEWAKTQLTARAALHNPSGVVHGGMIATLIDTSIAQALLMTDAYQVVRDTKGSMATIDLHIKYLRPVSAGQLICDARIVHLGKRIVHAQAVVSGDHGKPIALGDASMMLSPGEAQR